MYIHMCLMYRKFLKDAPQTETENKTGAGEEWGVTVPFFF